ncbi:MAG TPA: hypothetical protein VKV36_10615 [Acidimicrobiales bacterium]|nr:hypothetical protein [Acidimicrobiales bacterium]
MSRRASRRSALFSTVLALRGGNYGPGAMYQVEISANINPTSPASFQGNFWIWAALYPNGTVDYQETDCIHLGGGHATDAAAHDTSDGVTWYTSGGKLYLVGIDIIGNAETTTISVPLPTTGTYGHTQGMHLDVTSAVVPIIPVGAQLDYPSQNEIAP